jgi:hypothetical protein
VHAGGGALALCVVSTAALLVVGILALSGVYNTEFVAPIDVFDHVAFHSQPQPGMKVAS